LQVGKKTVRVPQSLGSFSPQAVCMPPRPVARELVHIIQKVCDEACADGQKAGRGTCADDPQNCDEACADGQKAGRGTCADGQKAHGRETCADDQKAHGRETCADGQKAGRGTCADSLRAIEERQSKEVEYFLRSCGVRLRHAVL